MRVGDRVMFYHFPHGTRPGAHMAQKHEATVLALLPKRVRIQIKSTGKIISVNPENLQRIKDE